MISLFLTLLGCAHAPQTAPPVVKVPTPVPCQTAVPDRPTLPADALTGAEDIFSWGTTMISDRLLREAYEIDLRTRLIGCTKP